MKVVCCVEEINGEFLKYGRTYVVDFDLSDGSYLLKGSRSVYNGDAFCSEQEWRDRKLKDILK